VFIFSITFILLGYPFIIFCIFCYRCGNCWIWCKGIELFPERSIEWLCFGRKALVFFSLFETNSCLGIMITAEGDLPTEWALLTSATRPGPCTYSTVGNKNYKLISLPKLALKSPNKSER
jgi:hypothetical protein